MALVDDQVDRFVEAGRGVQRDDGDARHHDFVETVFAELDDRMDHLLLFGFENALFASPFDDQHQLLCADLGLGPNLGAEQACYLPGDCRQQRDDRTQDARQEIHRP